MSARHPCSWTRRRWLQSTALTVSTMAAGIGRVWAEAPITVIVPQPAGNPSDVFIRKLAPHMERVLRRTVVVENLPGAGGAIGLQRVLQMPPDGNTLAMVSQTEPILTPLAIASARYQPQALRPVGVLGSTSYVLAGRSDLQAADLTQLLALARGSTDKPLTFGHIGNGSMIHLLGAQWSRAARAPLTHVPYRGVPPLVQDLAGGQIDLSFVPLGGTAMQLIGSGKLRVYGSTASSASALLPTAQPLSRLESALLKDFVYGAWGALMAPRATPDDALGRLNGAFVTAMRDPQVQAFLRENGTEPRADQDLAGLDAFYRSETTHYQRLARSIGIVAE